MNPSQFHALESHFRAAIAQVRQGVGVRPRPGRLAPSNPEFLMPRYAAARFEEHIVPGVSYRDQHIALATGYYGDTLSFEEYQARREYCRQKTNGFSDPRFLPGDYLQLVFLYEVLEKKSSRALATLRWYLNALQEHANRILDRSRVAPLPANAGDHLLGVFCGTTSCSCKNKRCALRHRLRGWFQQDSWPSLQLTNLGWPRTSGQGQYRQSRHIELEAHEVLDWTDLAYRIRHFRSGQVFDRLSTAVQGIVFAAADQFHADDPKWLKERKEERKKRPPPLGVPWPVALLDELNTLLLDPLLLDPLPSHADASVSKEARYLLAAKQHRPLRPVERFRLNRLLLEQTRDASRNGTTLFHEIPSQVLLPVPRVYPVDQFIYRAAIEADHHSRAFAGSLFAIAGGVRWIPIGVCTKCGHRVDDFTSMTCSNGTCSQPAEIKKSGALVVAGDSRWKKAKVRKCYFCGRFCTEEHRKIKGRPVRCWRPECQGEFPDKPHPRKLATTTLWIWRP